MDNEDDQFAKRGVKTKLLGVVMISLGVMDSLLTLRGGLPSEKYLVLIIAGAFVFAVGCARGARKPAQMKDVIE